jgi:hypothetical protein
MRTHKSACSKMNNFCACILNLFLYIGSENARRPTKRDSDKRRQRDSSKNSAESRRKRGRRRKRDNALRNDDDLHNRHRHPRPRRLRRHRRAGPRVERHPPPPLSSRPPPGRPGVNNRRRRRRLRLRRCGRPPPGRIPPFLDPSHKSTNGGKETMQSLNGKHGLIVIVIFFSLELFNHVEFKFNWKINIIIYLYVPDLHVLRIPDFYV